MADHPKPRQSEVNNPPARDTGLSIWEQWRWLKTEPLLRILLVLLIILASFFVTSLFWSIASYFSSLLLLFAAAWLLALMLTRPVRLMVNWGWPKMLSIAIAYGLLLAAITLFIIIVLPGLIAQTQALSNNLGNLTGELEKNLNEFLKGFGLSTLDLAQLSSQFQTFGADVLKNALGLATGIANFLVQLLLLIIISFSLMAGRNYSERHGLISRSQESQANSLWQQLPERYRRRAEAVRLSFEKNFGAYLGGQFLIAFIYGVITWIVMWAAGFDYPVTTGCICGALMVIPFFGGPLSLLPPLIVAFGRNDSPIIIVLVILFIIQTALLNVVLPKLVGGSSGVGPVMTLFVLLAGAQVGGIFGVLLAVPIAGVVITLASELIKELREKYEHEQPAAVEVKVATPGPARVDLEVSELVGSEKTKK